MDHIFQELIGKPTLKSSKLITIVAENFTFIEDQARFLKATLAIPTVKQLPLAKHAKILLQIGPLQSEIGEQVRADKWILNQYEDFNDSICDKIANDLLDVEKRSLVCLNDIARLELSAPNPGELKKILELIHNVQLKIDCFFVIFCQNRTNEYLRELKYLTDAFISVRSCKTCYLISAWYPQSTTIKSLIPPKTETCYYTNKIGKFYWMPNLLCFHDCRKVTKNFDPDCDNSSWTETKNDINSDDKHNRNGDTKLDGKTRNRRQEDEENNEDEEKDSTLPFKRAQNPEQSRIFYYPDKEDDFDEDDPDNDLNI